MKVLWGLFIFIAVNSYSQETSDASKNKTNTGSLLKEGGSILEIGGGLGIYKSEHYLKVGQAERISRDGTAAAKLFFKYEYIISKRQGIGFKLNYSKFVNGYDTVNSVVYTSKSNAIDFTAVLAVHLYSSNKFDLPLNINLGYSSFKLHKNDSLNNRVKTDGLNLGVYLNPRYFFTNHLGVFAFAGFSYFDYSKLIYYNDSNPDLNSFYQIKSTLKYRGADFGFGLVYKPYKE